MPQPYLTEEYPTIPSDKILLGFLHGTSKFLFYLKSTHQRWRNRKSIEGYLTLYDHVDFLIGVVITKYHYK
jgi:hypothetical protein